ncbi:MAG TPA: hypothetical protein VFG06_08745 [Thermodesulfovibrionales bacterium]|jgi:hypothetical protein|nr:hypothetical protein [Thermodesulfovibrionales bacterium]
MNQKSRKQTPIVINSLLKLATNFIVQAEIPNLDCYVKNLSSALRENDPSSLESNLLNLYTQLHGAGSVYSPYERKLLTERKGYSCYPGGLSPLIKAVQIVKPESIVADLGAGNGLQGLLLQCLSPHRKTIQIEISSEMIRIGRIFQQALGISDDRIEWIHDDIINVSIKTADFIYIYLPAKPLEGGKEVYEAIANKLSMMNRPLVIFSVADCLAKFLNGQFSIFYSDGHLTCFVKE